LNVGFLGLQFLKKYGIKQTKTLCRCGKEESFVPCQNNRQGNYSTSFSNLALVCEQTHKEALNEKVC